MSRTYSIAEWMLTHRLWTAGHWCVCVCAGALEKCFNRNATRSCSISCSVATLSLYLFLTLTDEIQFSDMGFCSVNRRTQTMQCPQMYMNRIKMVWKMKVMLTVFFLPLFSFYIILFYYLFVCARCVFLTMFILFGYYSCFMLYIVMRAPFECARKKEWRKKRRFKMGRNKIRPTASTTTITQYKKALQR